MTKLSGTPNSGLDQVVIDVLRNGAVELDPDVAADIFLAEAPEGMSFCNFWDSRVNTWNAPNLDQQGEDPLNGSFEVAYKEVGAEVKKVCLSFCSD